MRLIILMLLQICFMEFGGAQEGSGIDQHRIQLDKRGFSIIPPFSWEVKRDYLGASIYLEAPKTPGHEYKRNIRVMAFNGSQFIDDANFQSFAQSIQENSLKISTAISDYTIRDISPVDLGEGLKAGLFYADFKLSGESMMQMHVLASSADSHFLITYTDVAERFEDSSNGLLDEAYQSIQTINLDSSAPERSDLPLKASIGTAVFILLVSMIGLWRRRRTKKLAHGLDEYSADDHSQVLDKKGDWVQDNDGQSNSEDSLDFDAPSSLVASENEDAEPLTQDEWRLG